MDDVDSGASGDDEVLGPAVGSDGVVVEGAEVSVVGTTTVVGVDVEGADVDEEVATLVDVVVLEVGGACVVVVAVVEVVVGVDVDVGVVVDGVTSVVVVGAVVDVVDVVDVLVVVVGGVQFPCPVDVFRCPFDHTPNTVNDVPEYTTVATPDGPIEPECPRFVVNVIGIGSLFTIVHVDDTRSVHDTVV